MNPHKLIITTGDISDVDGFLALAHYAKSGADCIYVMNFPAYVGVEPDLDLIDDISYELLHPGCGYSYSAKSVLEKGSGPEYEAFVAKYSARGLTPNELMKSMLLDLSLEIVTRVWHENRPSGKLFFCIGGVNNTNPFSRQAVKNDIMTYAPLLEHLTTMLTVGDECDIMECGLEDAKDWNLTHLLVQYEEIYVDFNGSMAFYNNPVWRIALFANAHVVRGAFIMGGVLTSEPPKTKAAIPGILNRRSAATMNQLYDNTGTLDFFKDCSGHRVPIHVITNNVVTDFKMGGGIYRFMEQNNLKGVFLDTIAKEYYGAHNGVQKPFDFYCALALVSFMNDPYSLNLKPKPSFLIYCNKFAITFISPQSRWRVALNEYEASITSGVVDPNNKQALLKEIDSLRAEPQNNVPMTVFNTQVYEVIFTMADPSLLLRCDNGGVAACCFCPN